MKIIRMEDLTEFPEIRELTPEELKEAYALADAAFTAADLQRFTEDDEGVPIEQVLEEMEEIHKQVEEEKKAQ